VGLGVARGADVKGLATLHECLRIEWRQRRRCQCGFGPVCAQHSRGGRPDPALLTCIGFGDADEQIVSEVRPGASELGEECRAVPPIHGSYDLGHR
jgi:hypothetical protein